MPRTQAPPPSFSMFHAETLKNWEEEPGYEATPNGAGRCGNGQCRKTVTRVFVGGSGHETSPGLVGIDIYFQYEDNEYILEVRVCGFQS